MNQEDCTLIMIYSGLPYCTYEVPFMGQHLTYSQTVYKIEASVFQVRGLCLKEGT